MDQTLRLKKNAFEFTLNFYFTQGVLGYNLIFCDKRVGYLRFEDQ